MCPLFIPFHEYAATLSRILFTFSPKLCYKRRSFPLTEGAVCITYAGLGL
jgi:hypothetical protein